MKRKFKIALLSTVLLLTILSNVNISYGEENISIETYDGIRYRVNTGERWASVCGYVGDAEDVVIPSMVGRGIIVSEIEEHAFDGCNTIKILTIPDTIMSIGDTSFLGMGSLKAVISKTEGVNIVVRENVKIVSDRSQLGSTEEESSKPEETTGPSETPAPSVSPQPPTQPSTQPSTPSLIEDVGVVDDGEVQEVSTQYQEQSTESLSESSSAQTTEASSESLSKGPGGSSVGENSFKIPAIIICIVLLSGLIAGIIIFYSKNRR